MVAFSRKAREHKARVAELRDFAFDLAELAQERVLVEDKAACARYPVLPEWVSYKELFKERTDDLPTYAPPVEVLGLMELASLVLPPDFVTSWNVVTDKDVENPSVKTRQFSANAWDEKEIFPYIDAKVNPDRLIDVEFPSYVTPSMVDRLHKLVGQVTILLKERSETIPSLKRELRKLEGVLTVAGVNPESDGGFVSLQDNLNAHLAETARAQVAIAGAQLAFHRVLVEARAMSEMYKAQAVVSSKDVSLSPVAGFDIDGLVADAELDTEWARSLRTSGASLGELIEGSRPTEPTTPQAGPEGASEGAELSAQPSPSVSISPRNRDARGPEGPSI